MLVVTDPHCVIGAAAIAAIGQLETDGLRCNAETSASMLQDVAVSHAGLNDTGVATEQLVIGCGHPEAIRALGAPGGDSKEVFESLGLC